MQTLQVDFDRDRWLYVPARWPWQQYQSVQDWASAVAGLLGEELEFDQAERHWLSTSLVSLSTGADAGEHRFVDLADPRAGLALASVVQLDRDDGIPLEELAGAGDPAATQETELTAFTGRLGAGIRGIRYVGSGGESHDIAMIVQYAWRRDDADVVVMASDFALVRLLLLLPALDAIAASVDLVDADEVNAE